MLGRAGQLLGRLGQVGVRGVRAGGPQHEELAGDRQDPLGLRDRRRRVLGEPLVLADLDLQIRHPVLERVEQVRDRPLGEVVVRGAVDDLDDEGRGGGRVEPGQGDPEAGAAYDGLHLGQYIVQPGRLGAHNALHLQPQIEQLGELGDARVVLVQGGDGLRRQGGGVDRLGQATAGLAELNAEVGQLVELRHPLVQLGAEGGDGPQHLGHRSVGVGPRGQPRAQLLPPGHLRRQHRVLEGLIIGQPGLVQQVEDPGGALLGGLTAVGAVGLRLVLRGAGVVVDLVGLREQLLAHRPGAHGEVAAGAQGRDGGEDVVLGAVGGEIAHVGGEGLTFLERRPHGVEGAVRHLGMSDEVVRHLDQLFALGSGQAHEDIVRPLDDALGVRGREEDLIDADLVDRSRGGIGRHASRSSRSCSGDGTGLIAGGAAGGTAGHRHRARGADPVSRSPSSGCPYHNRDAIVIWSRPSTRVRSATLFRSPRRLPPSAAGSGSDGDPPALRPIPARSPPSRRRPPAARAESGEGS